jgi:type 1 fimbriae regulatory protein FimE
VPSASGGRPMRSPIIGALAGYSLHVRKSRIEQGYGGRSFSPCSATAPCPGLLSVQRLKRGVPSTHPVRGPELRALRQLRRDWPDTPYLFVSKRGGPMTASNVRKLVARTGLATKIPFPVHPHMLRHACGYKLANEGHDTRSLQHYLGHKNIAHTVRYTDLAPDRFKSFWKD